MSSEDQSEKLSADTDKAPRQRRGRPVKAMLLTLVGLLVISLGTYGVGYAVAGDRTPRNATVDGVVIGGMSRADAEATLERELAPRTSKPITLEVDGKPYKATPAELGLGVDIPATVAQSGVGRDADPRHIWKVLTGGGELDPVVTVDDAALQAYLTELAKKVERKPVDAKVAVSKGKVAYTKATQSRALDVGQSVALVKSTYLVGNEVTLPVTFADPEITDDDAAEAKAVATQIVAGPITVKVSGGGSYKVPVSSLEKSYSFPVKDGKIAAVLDTKKLYELNKEGLEALSTAEPQDARVEIRDGKPYIVPSKDGNHIDEKALVKAVQDSLAKEGKKRAATVKPNGVKAKHTTEDAKKAGVKEVVAEFTSSFPHDPVRQYRSTNLGVVARLIDDTYLKPGEQFSLNGQIGERTRAKGFVDGYFIEGGVLKQGLAGGISQSATTVFNAAFFAGVKLDEWQPHTLYFSRYPAGRESTVYLGAIDVKFTNDTPYGLVIQSWVNPAPPGGTGSMTVRIWSTKHYRVETAEPQKSGFYKGTTRWIDDPKCEYQAPIQGFTASYYRKVYAGGSLVKNENYSWKYSAGDEIKCGKKPSNDEDDS